MKDILPFIIAIAFFAYKQYKKSDKKKTLKSNQAKVHDEKLNAKEPSLDDFIGSFFGDQGLKSIDIDNAQEELIQDAVIEEDVNTTDAIETENTPYSIEYDDTVAVKKEQVDKGQFEKVKNKEQKLSQNLDFDLRNAIIYDAILNPPYISK